jgi:cyclophilin family peptidyl-prolyl cis-trans isomerase
MPRLRAALLAIVAAGFASASQPLAAQQGVITRETIALAGDRIRADRMYAEELNPGASQAVRMNRGADLDLLRAALFQPFPHLRAAALREWGRFQMSDNAEIIAALLTDPAAEVREAALDALTQALLDQPEQVVAQWLPALEDRVRFETPEMAAAIWKTIAEWPIPGATSLKYERLFLNEILQQTPMMYPALDALLVLAQHRRNRPFERVTEDRIRAWAMRGLESGDTSVKIGFIDIGPTIRYVQVLHAAHADGDEVAIRASTFVCRTGFDCGSDIRELGVGLLNPQNPSHRPALMAAAVQKRHPALVALAIRKLIAAKEMPLCELFELSKQTDARVDVIKALGEQSADDLAARTSTCGDWSPNADLLARANDLISAELDLTWVEPAQALEALATRLPDDARRLATEVATKHKQWPVRVSAARVATTLKDEALLVTLGADAHHNVRAEVIRGLVTLRSPALWVVALDALTRSSDYRLILVAAQSLRGYSEPDVAMPILVAALRRITIAGRDTNRRARLALLDRIEEFFVPALPDTVGWMNEIRPLLSDFDPVVAHAVARVLTKASGSPYEATPTRRAAEQPGERQLAAMTTCVMINFTSGARLLVILNRMGAPIAVARFLAAASAGHFNGVIVTRVDENGAAFGSPGGPGGPGSTGGPGNNDEGGWERFAREDLGATVTPRTMTLVGHGADTLDGRLAVSFVNRPDAHRRVTVLGRVESMGPTPYVLFNSIESVELSGVGRAGRLPNQGDPCDPRLPWR